MHTNLDMCGIVVVMVALCAGCGPEPVIDPQRPEPVIDPQRPEPVQPSNRLGPRVLVNNEQSEVDFSDTETLQQSFQTLLDRKFTSGGLADRFFYTRKQS